MHSATQNLERERSILQRPDLAPNSQNDEYQKLANFMALRTVENQLPANIFGQVRQFMDQPSKMPERLAVDGSFRGCSFHEQKILSGLESSAQLSSQLKNQLSTTQNILIQARSAKAPQTAHPAFKKWEIQSIPKLLMKNLASFPFLCNFKNRAKLDKLFKVYSKRGKDECLANVVLNHDRHPFQLMKTVFGHANFSNGNSVPVYNVLFALDDTIVITGADDGIIKIWSTDTLMLQAALHGHKKEICYMYLSLCERFLASASSDGVIILWDVKECTMIKKLTDHTARINELFFYMAPKQEQAQKKASDVKNGHRNDSVSKSRARELQYAKLVNFDKSEVENPNPNLTSLKDGPDPIQISSFEPIEYNQFLISCSDDGSINIYDVRSFTLGGKKEYYTKTRNKYVVHGFEEEQKQREPKSDDEGDIGVKRMTRKRKNQQISASQESQPQQGILISHTQYWPVEHKPGTKPKHIDSISMSPKGFLVAGTNVGEIYMWKINFSKILGQSQKKDSSEEWIGSQKIFKRTVTNLEFSPAGDKLIVVSNEGQFQIYDTSFKKKEVIHKKGRKYERVRNLSQGEIELSSDLIIHQFGGGESANDSIRIDNVEWSKQGRYAFYTVSTKQELNEESEGDDPSFKKEAIVEVRAFDTLTKTLYDDLNKHCKYESKTFNYSNIIKAHPRNEHIVIICFDGGVVLIYDLKNMRIVQKVEEKCMHSVDEFTMTNVLDIAISQDGEQLAMSSLYGTLSIWSQTLHQKSQYQATRIQQFFDFEKDEDFENPFEKKESPPLICDFDMQPYVHQPRPIVGKFRTHPSFDSITAEEYKKKLNTAIAMAEGEEQYQRERMEDAWRQGLFRGQALIESGAESEHGAGSNRFFEADHEASDAEMIARVHDDDFDGTEDQSLDQDDEMEDLDSESGVGIRRRRHYRRRDSQLSQGQLKEIQENCEQQMEEMDESQIAEYYGSLTKQQLMQASEQQLRDDNLIDLVDDENSDERILNRPKKRTVRKNSLDDDISDDENFMNMKNRCLRSNVRRHIDSEDEEEKQVKTRAQRVSKRSRQSEDIEKELDEEFGEVYKITNTSRRHEHKKEASSKQDDDDVLEQHISQNPMETQIEKQRDDDYSVRGGGKSSAQKHSTIKLEGKFPEFKRSQLDAYYILSENPVPQNGPPICSLCQKRINGESIGPFVHNPEVGPDIRYPESVIFHTDCLRFNAYVILDAEERKWLGIRRAIENLVLKKQFTCYRCLTPGASVQCQRCLRNFHGHICKDLYLMPQDEDETTFQCIICTNQKNYQKNQNKLKDEIALFRKTKLDVFRREIDKDHLLETQVYDNSRLFYVPQVDDEVVLFLQGFEKFFQLNNCYFYSGNNREVRSTDLLWLRYPELRKVGSSVKCQVTKVSFRFPSPEASRLLFEYRDCSSSIMQTHEIMIYLELKVLEEELEDGPDTIFCQIFPTIPELYQCIIPWNLYVYKKEQFNRFLAEGKLYGGTFRTHNSKVFSGRQVKVLEVSPAEPEVYPESDWESVIVKEKDESSLVRHDRRVQSEDVLPMRINFWDIIYEEDAKTTLSSLASTLMISVFTPEQNIELAEIIKQLMEKKKQDQLLTVFEKRVDQREIEDYRSFVHYEMYTELILQRLYSNYYRSKHALLNDIQAIYGASEIYNGDNDITESAKRLTTKLKNQLTSKINTYGLPISYKPKSQKKIEDKVKLLEAEEKSIILKGAKALKSLLDIQDEQLGKPLTPEKRGRGRPKKRKSVEEEKQEEKPEESSSNPKPATPCQQPQIFQLTAPPRKSNLISIPLDSQMRTFLKEVQQRESSDSSGISFNEKEMTLTIDKKLLR